MKIAQRRKTVKLWTEEKAQLETMATVHHIHFPKHAGPE